ncbi:hypothetical protein FJB87_20525 [Salmonella enterica subsp. enterica]|uniref:spore coat protein U domain-containing protein n=1 Tax=Salmonella enterica TaxID=28901 RepID=UPI0012BF01E8|nr:spore coat protein U domain-containing protein [Salmonella enterica]EBG6822367.1 hypothetical protein [Salmonella enterica subsp. enterica]EBY2673447.1 hypothetical protein [Salmonella enterica subsp. enterica serovar Schwarzengrund]ECN6007744.1 hypothetical protein [Salmonella enterica subsp. enterica serovar Brandenburg]EHX6838313.1 spore coat protein U domain-containing protein [Salmonella enterica subsp. enterica serovar Muenster]EBG6926396.1 hypothetical protein [Salmonella enterica su
MLFYNKKILFFIFYFIFSEQVSAECAAAISLPLAMNGTQTQLMWSGTIGGSGSGHAISNCPAVDDKRYLYDFRYNIIETNASCVNTGSGSVFSAPVITDSAVIQTGSMQKLNSIIFAGKTYDIWGALFASPASNLGFNSTYGGSYTTNARINISSLPAGNYRCNVKNSHGAFRTDINSLESGAQSIFNYTEQSGGWATGEVNITMNASCSIPDSLNINHGTLKSGEQNAKQDVIKITCNKDFNMSVTLKADGDLAYGVMVKLKGNNENSSKSILSTSGDGKTYGKNTSVNVKSNVPQIIYFRSILQASGEGPQFGSALAQINYH